MVEFVDKVDSGNLSSDEILHPKGWILLGFIMDPRTGLGRFHDFGISNYDLMKLLARACREKSIDEILAMPDVKERIDLYNQQEKLFREMIEKHAKVEGRALIIDMRGQETIQVGNRFLVYTMFPEQNISVFIVDGKNRQNCAITVGYSIINRSATVNVGSLLLKYGGGGHVQVGTCQVDYDAADRVIREIVEAVR
jgi:nanoRNase/pAp phosphatase (c-di-AMP/oligoRNAs hydrolase)